MDKVVFKKRIAVVILNWNGASMLDRYLPDVVRYSSSDKFDVKVYVIDNASTDNSVELLKRDFPEVGLIVLDTNYGFAGGYNRGLKHIDSEYYVLLNSDVRVTPDWLLPIAGYMEQHADVAACQPKLLSERNNMFFEYAGAAGGFIDKYGYPFCRGRLFSQVEKDNGQYDDDREIFWASGAALFVRSDVFWKAGAFDESFFAHMEEIDLCWRIRNEGYRIMYIHSSVVYHVGAATLKKESPFKTYLNFRNNLFMLYKNLPDKCFRRVMLTRKLLDFMSFMMFVLTFNWKAAGAVYRARRDFNASKHKYSRLEGRNSGRFPDMDFSVVLHYYFLGKKTFDRLPL